jgi:hypothetical protein
MKLYIRWQEMAKTVLFEDRYKTNISKFSSTEQITEFLEDTLGRPLEVISINQNIVTKRGNVFPIVKVDIDKKIDKAISLHSHRASKIIKMLKSNR